ncbi:unnamed protein product [Ectocarpus sp. CCAP 1310/34]|nr:unnamed protein product [Ectocarpus sp. CCAP 1310/34]CAB1098676.1 unnamed protein product [Ectocarpus sp. CCAP 1310/34]CAB1112414.1 unnamed protein product [Ectocarpus sp. CCAP 1310/34]CAB1112711.1 unnamed protein product [Ectocarpus sp. CCAP 1310/34]CAB1115235.1 unnamed protein product [Ectocarpus sp. CCAP 1310/34]
MLWGVRGLRRETGLRGMERGIRTMQLTEGGSRPHKGGGGERIPREDLRQTWELALRRPDRQEQWDGMRGKHTMRRGRRLGFPARKMGRSQGVRPHPREQWETMMRKHPRKKGEMLGIPARRVDRSHSVAWITTTTFGRKARRTAKETTIRLTVWMISGSTSTETCWWTTSLSYVNGGTHCVTHEDLP